MSIFELLAYMLRYCAAWKEKKPAATAQTAWFTSGYISRLKLILHDDDGFQSNILVSLKFRQNQGQLPPSSEIVSSVLNHEKYRACKDASTIKHYKGLRSFDMRIDTVNMRKATNQLLDL
jgi:hypothetical protein